MALALVVWILVSAVWQFAYGGCNQKHAAKPNEVTYITSPGYPGNFTQFVDCYYELYSTSDHPGLVVYIDVVDVTLKCDDDTTQLHVYDGFSRNPRFLGRICEGSQRTFQSPKQTLYLTFRSRAHHEDRSRGFRLRVRTVPKYCHCFTQETAVLDVTSSPAPLSTPYYPYGTEPNVNCHWLLKAPEGKRVNVTLLHTDMKGSGDCRHFGLYLYDGKTSYDDKLLTSVCRNSAQSLQSSGPYLLVVFTSGSMVFGSGGGVKLQYSAIPAAAKDRQTISHTLFYIITALLILLIFVIVFLAIIKLFLLPKRRKEAERRRRAARARLTRVNRHGSSQSDSSSQSESGRHAPCSRASSSMSGTSVSSQLSGMSLTRLLSLYGLKKCRQEHRCSSRAGHAPDCLHNSHRAGIVFRLPEFSMLENQGILPGDLPPSYEEAIRQGITGQGVTGQEVRGEEVEGQSGTRQSVERQSSAQPVSDTRGEGHEHNAASEDLARQDNLTEALEHAVVAEVMRQTAHEHSAGQASTDHPHSAADTGAVAESSPLQEVPQQTLQALASRCSAHEQEDTDWPQQTHTQRQTTSEELASSNSLGHSDVDNIGRETSVTAAVDMAVCKDELSAAAAAATSAQSCSVPESFHQNSQESACYVSAGTEAVSIEMASECEQPHGNNGPDSKV